MVKIRFEKYEKVEKIQNFEKEHKGELQFIIKDMPTYQQNFMHWGAIEVE